MPSLEGWLERLDARHRNAFESREFLKAVRALSARYVERREALPNRAVFDSAGKRAAFAAFYGPLHFLTTREVVRGIGAGARDITTIVDLGCGTGAASAAWALECPSRPAVIGIDRDRWALGEAADTWRHFGLAGRPIQGDLAGRGATRLLRSALRRASGSGSPRHIGILAAWTINEMNEAARDRLLPELVAAVRSGASILVLEPLARLAAPWWDNWTSSFLQNDPGSRFARNDTWRVQTPLPPTLAETSEAAGFRREALTARSLYVA
jgi:hypothetical protein